MASQIRSSEHRNYKIRGHGTRRHQKKGTALSKGRGEKQLHKAGIEITSCGLCEWVRGSDNKTMRPVEVRITGKSSTAKCPGGHKWKIL